MNQPPLVNIVQRFVLHELARNDSLPLQHKTLELLNLRLKPLDLFFHPLFQSRFGLFDLSLEIFRVTKYH